MNGSYILLVLVLAITIPSFSLGSSLSRQEGKVGAATEPAKRGIVGVGSEGQGVGNPATSQDPIKSKRIPATPKGGSLLDKPTFGEKF